MENLIETPLFGILLSIIAYELGLLIFRRTRLEFLNPLLVGIVIVMGVLSLFDVALEDYQQGGNYILFLLGPATVILAVPLYNQIPLLKKFYFPILMGIVAGSVTAISSVWMLSNLLGVEELLKVSMLPKSVTNPIGIEISRQVGGDPSLTVAVIVITGIVGAVTGPKICQWFNIHNDIAQGVSMGTAAHGLGTAKALELGEVQGAMSSLSIGLTGLTTVFAVPLFLWLFG